MAILIRYLHSQIYCIFFRNHRRGIINLRLFVHQLVPFKLEVFILFDQQHIGNPFFTFI